MRFSVVQSVSLLLAVTAAPILASPVPPSSSSSVDVSPRNTDLQTTTPNVEKRMNCNSSPGIFATVRCVLRRGLNNPGPRTSVPGGAVWQVANSLWTNMIRTTRSVGFIESEQINGVQAMIGLGWQSETGDSTYNSLVQRVTGADLWDAILQAVTDAVNNSPGITTYYISDLYGRALATITISTAAPFSVPSFSSFPAF